MGTRFTVEVAAHFHPEIFRESWRAEAKQLNRDLTRDSVRAMREIIGFVKARKSSRQEGEFTAALAARLRATERGIHAAAGRLEAEIQSKICKTAQWEAEFRKPGGITDEKEPSAKQAVAA
jgi:hypothetical protein